MRHNTLLSKLSITKRLKRILLLLAACCGVIIIIKLHYQSNVNIKGFINSVQQQSFVHLPATPATPARNSYKIQPEWSRLKVYVIGAMSFPGARLAYYLHNKGYNVAAIEDSVNIKPNKLSWYRWTQLTNESVHSTLIDFSSSNFNKLVSMLRSGTNITVIYVPTGIIEMTELDDSLKLVQQRSAMVAHLSKLMTTLVNISTIKQFILLQATDSTKININQAIWMSSIWQSVLGFYRNHHYKKNFGIALVKANGVYGPWKSITDPLPSDYNCVYIDSLASIIVKQVTYNTTDLLSISDLSNQCESESHDGTIATLQWRKQYKKELRKQTKNAFIGGVLRYRSKHAHWPGASPSNDHHYFMNFVLTALKHSPDVVIIHNSLSDRFVKSYKDTVCPSCKFVKYSLVNERIAHDQRLYMIYDYLLKHPEIDKMVTSDIKDVVFPADPFDVMSDVGDYVFAGLDVPPSNNVKTLLWLPDMIRKCFPNYKYTQQVNELYGVFNSGSLGGSRHIMLTLLSRMVLYLETASLEGVCDMTSAQLVLHMHMYHLVYAGYPFAGTFLLATEGPQGAAVKHKLIHIRFPISELAH